MYEDHSNQCRGVELPGYRLSAGRPGCPLKRLSKFANPHCPGKAPKYPILEYGFFNL